MGTGSNQYVCPTTHAGHLRPAAASAVTTAGRAGSTATVRTRPRSLTDRIALAPASATYVVPWDDVVA